MKYHYTTSGTCSRAIDFEIIGGKLHNVQFTGGCNGNLKGIGRLVEGADAITVAKPFVALYAATKLLHAPTNYHKLLNK